MRVHNNLPGYYNGLTRETVRGLYPAQVARFPMTQPITKIPVLVEPTQLANRVSLSLDVSGVRAEDIAVIVDGNQLIVELEKEFHPFRVTHTNWDKCYGIFRRAFTLPEGVVASQIHYRVRAQVLEIDIMNAATTQVTPDSAQPQAPAPEKGTQPQPTL
jgi:HSP20 family molecular chaperone IbpA